MTYKEDLDIINDIRQYSTVLSKTKYQILDVDDIESELMYWLAGKPEGYDGNRLDYLKEVKAENEIRYRGYLKTSTINLLNKKIKKHNLQLKKQEAYITGVLNGTDDVSLLDICEGLLFKKDKKLLEKIKDDSSDLRWNDVYEVVLNNDYETLNKKDRKSVV